MKLKEYLEHQGITVTGFAKRLGIARNTLSRIVNGSINPSPQLAIKIEKETNGAVTKEELRPDIFQ